VSHKPGGRLPLRQARSYPLNPWEGCYQFCCLVKMVNRGTVGVNSYPKTVTRQRRGCDLNPGPSAPESSTLTTRPLVKAKGWKSARRRVTTMEFPLVGLSEVNSSKSVNASRCTVGSRSWPVCMSECSAWRPSSEHWIGFSLFSLLCADVNCDFVLILILYCTTTYYYVLVHWRCMYVWYVLLNSTYLLTYLLNLAVITSVTVN